MDKILVIIGPTHWRLSVDSVANDEIKEGRSSCYFLGKQKRCASTSLNLSTMDNDWLENILTFEFSNE